MGHGHFSYTPTRGRLSPSISPQIHHHSTHHPGLHSGKYMSFCRTYIIWAVFWNFNCLLPCRLLQWLPLGEFEGQYMAASRRWVFVEHFSCAYVQYVEFCICFLFSNQAYWYYVVENQNTQQFTKKRHCCLRQQYVYLVHLRIVKSLLVSCNLICKNRIEIW